MRNVVVGIGAGVTPCPRCEYPNDRLGPANVARGVAHPRLGDLILCLQCGLLEEVTTLGRRVFSSKDVDALPADLRAQICAIERARTRVLGDFLTPTKNG